MTNFFKKSQKPYFEPILGSLCPNLGQKWIFLEERVHTKKRFVLLISLWDTANFRVLQLIEKSCHLIGQEHFGPYLRTRTFPNMTFVQACKNYSNINFHYRSNLQKNIELRKKILNFFKESWAWPIFPILGEKHDFEKVWPCHTQHHRGP